MPIQGIEQPEVIWVDDGLRLRKYDGSFAFAFDWYQDEDMVTLVDGAKSRYTMERLEQMYRYLDSAGELYFIEILENGNSKPIGDVTFWREDMPIVIGEKAYRNRGIGRRVIAALVERGRSLGYRELYVGEIYDFNPASRKCFESVGFERCEKTNRGARYVLRLSKKEN